MTDIPHDAERFNLFDYTTMAQVPSRLLPGAKQIKPALRCPGCGLRLALPQIGEAIACEPCGVTLCIDGVDLRVWPTAKEAANAQ